MTGKEFLNSLANGKSDVIQMILDILCQTDSSYCLIVGTKNDQGSMTNDQGSWFK